MVGMRARVVYCIVASATLLLVHTIPSAGQGLLSTPRALGSSMTSSRTLLAQYAAARAQAAAWLSSASTSARTSCRSTSGSSGRARLCAAQAITTSAAAVDQAALLLAVGPKSYDGRLLNLFSPVGDQDKCSTCVPFTLAAAAEAVAAKALGLPGGSVSLSEQDIGFCPVDSANSKFCPTGMSLASTISRLGRPVVTKTCLPYTIAPGSDDPSTLCEYACKDPADIYEQGTFSSFSLTQSIPAIQAAIRKHGAVVTRLNVYPELRPFFTNNPTGVYGGEDCDISKPVQEEHAIVLVGYDNNKGFWVARNSWGSNFADSGYFRIKYGVCGVGAVGDTFGLKFMLKSPTTTTLKLTPDPEQTGCFVYRATNADTIWSLADRLDVDAVQLLANNSVAIADPTAPLGGKLITLCAAGRQSRIALPTGAATPNTPAIPDTPAPVKKPVPAPTREPDPAPAPANAANQPTESPAGGSSAAPAAPEPPNEPAPAPAADQDSSGNSGGRSVGGTSFSGIPFMPRISSGSRGSTTTTTTPIRFGTGQSAIGGGLLPGLGTGLTRVPTFGLGGRRMMSA